MKSTQKRKHQQARDKPRDNAAAALEPHARFAWSALASAMVTACPRSRNGNFSRVIELAERVRSGRNHVTPGTDLSDWLDAQRECEYSDAG